MQLDEHFTAEETKRLEELVRASPGIDNITHHPVDRARGRATGFDWVDSPAYVAWCDSRQALSSRDGAEAEICARRSIEAAPDNAHVWALLSRILDMNRKPIEAEVAIRQALALQPNNPGIAGAYCRHLLRHAMPNRAQRAAESARDRFPTDTTGFANLAEALFMQGKRDAGLAAVKDMLSRARPHAATFLNLLRYMIASDLSNEAAEVGRQMQLLLPKDEALRKFCEQSSESIPVCPDAVS